MQPEIRWSQSITGYLFHAVRRLRPGEGPETFTAAALCGFRPRDRGASAAWQPFAMPSIIAEFGREYDRDWRCPRCVKAAETEETG